jgi:hypothetical protein
MLSRKEIKRSIICESMKWKKIEEHPTKERERKTM